MAKKKISMDQLEVGMFMEADIKEGAKGASSKNVLLLGKGVLITSANQIRRLKEAGLTNVTIDTSKGKDIPGGQVVAAPVQIKEAKKQKPPGGRQAFFREEVKVAQKIRGASVKVVKEFMHNAATGASIDTQKVTLAAKTLTGSIFRNVDALLSLTALKNYSEHTYTHSVNVCVLTLAIAHATGVTEEETTEIGVGGLLHDVGKSIIPLSILDKPGPLTQEERQTIMNHPVESERILREQGQMSEAAIAIAAQHHEKVNGSGYPRGLSGDQMHPFASMSAVADVYDALTSARPYKPGLPPHIALRVVFDGKGTEFKDSVVETFIKSLGIYPVGSFVKLNTGEMGIVMEVNPEDSVRPKVGILFTKYGNRRPGLMPIDLYQEFRESGAEKARSITAADDPRKHEVNIEEYLDSPM